MIKNDSPLILLFIEYFAKAFSVLKIRLEAMQESKRTRIKRENISLQKLKNDYQNEFTWHHHVDDIMSMPNTPFLLSVLDAMAPYINFICSAQFVASLTHVTPFFSLNFCFVFSHCMVFFVFLFADGAASSVNNYKTVRMSDTISKPVIYHVFWIKKMVWAKSARDRESGRLIVERIQKDGR